MANKKIKHEIECPYCHKTMGKQGIYGHIRGNHKGMEDDYRARFPPKMTSLKPKDKEPDPDPDPDPEIIEKIMNEEPQPETKSEPKPKLEPAKEVPKPEPIIVKDGDKKSKKGDSFLDWLFGEEEDKPSVSKPKPDSKDKDDDWW